MKSNKYAGCALIDNDFFLCFSSIKKIDGGELFKKVFNFLKITPYVHDYIFSYEMMENSLARQLKDEGFLKILSWLEIFGIGNQESKKIYENQIRLLYKALTGKNLRIKKDVDITKFHIAGRSLGEINSLYTAKEKEINIFCSNDHDSVELRNKLCQLGFQVQIYNIDYILTLDCLSADERKYLSATLTG